jgi:hypothetical protein
MPENENIIHSATDLFGNYRLAEKFKPNGSRVAGGERGQLIGYFARKMGWTALGMANTLGHVKDISDLYALKSDCDAAEREGRCAWPAAFRTALGIAKKKA